MHLNVLLLYVSVHLPDWLMYVRLLCKSTSSGISVKDIKVGPMPNPAIWLKSTSLLTFAFQNCAVARSISSFICRAQLGWPKPQNWLILLTTLMHKSTWHPKIGQEQSDWSSCMDLYFTWMYLWNNGWKTKYNDMD